MKDIKIFHLHHSQIPTALLKQIVQDIDNMLIQYGPPVEHQTNEVTSRFVSLVSVSHPFRPMIHSCSYSFHP